MAKHKTVKDKIPKDARKFISRHVRRHINIYGMSQKQAVAVALTEAREKGYNIPIAMLRSKAKVSGV